LIICFALAVILNVKQYNQLKYIENEVETISSEIETLQGTISEKDTVISEKEVIEKVSTTGSTGETNPQQGGGSANYSGDNLPQPSPEEVARQLGITYGGDGSQNPSSGYDGPPLF